MTRQYTKCLLLSIGKGNKKKNTYLQDITKSEHV